MKKVIISQKWINGTLFLSFFSIVFLIINSSTYIRSCVLDEQDAEQRKTQYVYISETLADSSDYLTDEARKYVTTLELEHLYNYWKEVNEVKSREKVIITLSSLNLPKNEEDLLNRAKNNSDLLVDSETRAMRLVLDVMEIDETHIPVNVKAYELSPSEKNLSHEQKLARARDIMFGEQYTNDKKTIIGSIEEFQITMRTRLEAELAKVREGTRQALTMQIVLLCTVFLLTSFVLLVVYLFFVSPIQSYTKDLKKEILSGQDKLIQPKGSKELHMFAQEFNKLYLNLLEANQSKSKFLAAMSHEIRTPLNAILGYAKLLEMTPLNNNQHLYIENINISSKNLLQLINQILDYSKLENHKFQLENVEFDLHKLLLEIAQLFQYEADKRGLTILISMDESLVTSCVKGDVGKLNLIITNLVSNAVKFTEKGTVTIGTKVITQSNNKVNLQIFVRDTGIGIKEQDKERIFESFEQADSSISRKYGGTGLGLAISREMAVLMNGSLQVDSLRGQGSTFVIELELEVGSLITRSESNYSLNKKVDFDGKRALLVDDNPLNLMLEKEILNQYGFEVVIAESGKRAVKLAEQVVFHLIFMDIRMPGMDGFETTKIIRTGVLNRETAIIALTADVEESTLIKISKSGMNDCLIKPIDTDKLITLLKNHLPDEGVLKEKQVHEGKSWIQKNKYLSCEKCIQGLNGNAVVYEAVLRRFLKDHSNEMAKIMQLYQNGDDENLKSKIHMLKGVCGNIGADLAKRGLEKLEITLCHLDNESAYQLEQIKKAEKIYNKTVNAARNFSTHSIKAESWEKNRQNDFQQVLEKIDQHLQLGEIEAYTLLEKNKIILEKNMPKDRFLELVENIEQYNFVDAHGVIEEWRVHHV